MLKKYAGIGLGIVLLAAPLASSAQSAADIQAQIEALLQKVKELQEQLVNLQGRNGSSSLAPAPVGRCLALSRTLAVGFVGDDVSELQRFLAEQGFYSAQMTGYFGPITEAAVRAFQSTNGIAVSGDAESTGWGLVGPATRALIARACKSTSQFSDNDWTNGYGILGLPASGISQTRTSSDTALPTPIINSFTATPDYVAGQSSTLAWSAANVQYGGCYIFEGNFTESITPSSNWGASGMFAVTPSVTTTYKLWCTSSWKDGSPIAEKTVTVTVASPTSSVPTNLSGICSADGSHLDLSWSPVAGALGYYLRVDDPTNNGPQCEDGWMCEHTQDFKSDVLSGTSHSVYVLWATGPNASYQYVSPANVTYRWWVSAIGGGTSEAAYSTVRCDRAASNTGPATNGPTQGYPSTGGAGGTNAPKSGQYVQPSGNGAGATQLSNLASALTALEQGLRALVETLGL